MTPECKSDCSFVRCVPQGTLWATVVAIYSNFNSLSPEYFWKLFSKVFTSVVAYHNDESVFFFKTAVEEYNKKNHI